MKVSSVENHGTTLTLEIPLDICENNLINQPGECLSDNNINHNVQNKVLTILVAEDNLIKLNQLIKYLYPAFAERGTANSISAAPLFRIKFANLIYDASSNSPGGDAQESGLVCAIGNFKHAFSFDGSSGWLDKVGKAIPSTFSISFNATILHTHDLGRINRQYPNQGDEQFPYRVDLSERRRRLEEEFDARADAALKLADSQPTLDELIANRPRANTGTITEGDGE